MKPALSIVPASPVLKKLTPEEEDRWAQVHIAGDRRKPLPEWWGKRR
jgi:hypothetical protein